jgi:predicted Holliday junction resolvase-like endonuclease
MIIFILTVTLSRMSERVRKLAQALALNEEKIEQLMKEQDKTEDR